MRKNWNKASQVFKDILFDNKWWKTNIERVKQLLVLITKYIFRLHYSTFSSALRHSATRCKWSSALVVSELCFHLIFDFAPQRFPQPYRPCCHAFVCFLPFVYSWKLLFRSQEVERSFPTVVRSLCLLDFFRALLLSNDWMFFDTLRRKQFACVRQTKIPRSLWYALQRSRMALVSLCSCLRCF